MMLKCYAKFYRRIWCKWENFFSEEWKQLKIFLLVLLIRIQRYNIVQKYEWSQWQKIRKNTRKTLIELKENILYYNVTNVIFILTKNKRPENDECLMMRVVRVKTKTKDNALIVSGRINLRCYWGKRSLTREVYSSCYLSSKICWKWKAWQRMTLNRRTCRDDTEKTFSVTNCWKKWIA